jgi:choline dehydrogenase
MPGHPGAWGSVGTLLPGVTLPIPGGKVMGGSSSVNGTYFIRGRRADFDGWESLGNTEWSYEKVLPFFKRIESDADFAGEHHGSSGPIPVRRETVDRAPELIEAFTTACSEHGFPREADKNAEEPAGVGPVPLNIGDGMRVGTAVSYILPRLHRDNFDVQGHAYVRRILFDGNRAVGVEATIEGKARVVRAGEVVLSAGAIRSPHVLLLSGIGPADDLRRIGVDVVADVPGVGKGLHAHPELITHYTLSRPVESPEGRGVLGPALHWTAGGSSAPDDLEIFPLLRTTLDMIEARGHSIRSPIRTIRALRGSSLRALAAQAEATKGAGSVVLGLMQEESRGEINLRSADPDSDPEVNFRFLDEPGDLRRLRELTRMYHSLFNSAQMKAIGARKIGLTGSDMRDERSLDAWIRSHLLQGAHAASTCRMGLESDPLAVVDQFGRVHGVDGLRIADTSIWPAVTSRGPAATAIMTGERIAAFMEA